MMIVRDFQVELTEMAIGGYKATVYITNGHIRRPIGSTEPRSMVSHILTGGRHGDGHRVWPDRAEALKDARAIAQRWRNQGTQIELRPLDLDGEAEAW